MYGVYIYPIFILANFSPLFSTLYYTDKDILTYLSHVRLITSQSTTKSPKPVFLVNGLPAEPNPKHLNSALPKSFEKPLEFDNDGLTDIQPVTDPTEICISEPMISSELDNLQGKLYLF